MPEFEKEQGKRRKKEKKEGNKGRKRGVFKAFPIIENLNFSFPNRVNIFGFSFGEKP